MHVVHYIWSANIGGIEKLVFQLCIQQQQDDIKPFVLVGKSEGHLSAIYFNVFQKYLNLKNGFSISFKVLVNAYKIFKNADIIHIHTFHPILFFVAVMSQKPIIYHEHGNWVSGRSITFADKFKKMLLKIGLIFFTKKIIFNSNFTQKKCASYYGLKFLNPLKHKVIYNGILFDTENIKKENAIFTLGTCSRLAYFKRVDRVLFCFKAFLKNKSDVQLNIIGDGPLKKELEDLTKTLSISDKVNFKGAVTNVSLCQSEFDVAVLGSQEEPFGLVAIECLSFGIPVLVFNNAGGMVETISNFNKNDIANNEQEMVSQLNDYYNLWKKKLLPVLVNHQQLNRYSMDRFSKNIMSEYKAIIK